MFYFQNLPGTANLPYQFLCSFCEFTCFHPLRDAENVTLPGVAVCWRCVLEVLWTQPTCCWWFRNPANQLRLVVYPIMYIYKVIYIYIICIWWCRISSTTVFVHFCLFFVGVFYFPPWEITIKLPFGEYFFPTTWSKSMFRVFGMKWTVFGFEFLAPLPSSTCRFILGLCWVSTSLKK